MQRWICRRALALAVFGAALTVAIPIASALRPAKTVACSEIVAGAVLSLTGVHSAGGNDVRHGYEFAIRRLNERGGIRIRERCYNLRIIYHDDESNAARAAELAEQLVERDNVRFLLGPYGFVRTEAVAAVASRRQVPLIAIEGRAVPPGTPVDRRFVFPLLPAPDATLAGLADYLAHLAGEVGREPGDLRLALVTDGVRPDGGARALLEARSRKHGIALVLDEAFDRKLGDLTQIMARIRAERPDALLIDAHAGAAMRALETIDEMALEVPILAMTNCESARVTTRAKERADNILCVGRWGADLGYTDEILGSPDTFERDFIASRRAAGAANVSAPVPAQTAYAAVAVRMLATAIETAGTLDHFQVRDTLALMRAATLVGPVSFGAEDRKPAPLLIRQIVRGDYVPVWPPGTATATYRWPRIPNGPF